VGSIIVINVSLQSLKRRQGQLEDRRILRWRAGWPLIDRPRHVIGPLPPASRRVRSSTATVARSRQSSSITARILTRHSSRGPHLRATTLRVSAGGLRRNDFECLAAAVRSRPLVVRTRRNVRVRRCCGACTGGVSCPRRITVSCGESLGRIQHDLRNWMLPP